MDNEAEPLRVLSHPSVGQGGEGGTGEWTGDRVNEEGSGEGDGGRRGSGG